MLIDEQRLIGSCLQNPDICLSKIVETDVEPEMLKHPFYQKTLRMMLARYNTGEHISMESIRNDLVDEGYEQETVESFLTEAAVNSGFYTEINEYIRTIIRSYKSVTIRKFIDENDFSESGIEKTIPKFALLVENLMDNTNLSVISMKELIEKCKGNYFTEKTHNNDIRTNIGFLDDSVISFERGDITVIGARPGVGKSALAAQIIGNVSETKKVGYFNYEMEDSQIYERFLSRYMETGLTRIRRAIQFIGSEKEKFDKANAIIKELNFEIINSNPTITKIREICKYKKYDLVVIDYLQLIPIEKNGRTRTEEIGEITRKLKNMAKDLKLHVILLSQLNRGSEYQMDMEPTMKDLRESGNIEQDASNIIMLWNLSKEDYRYKGFCLSKCRQGVPGVRKVLAYNKNNDFIFEEEEGITVDQFSKSNEPRRSRDPDYRME